MAGDPVLRCELLGGFRLVDSAGEEIRIPVAKGAAIVAYLLLSPKNFVTRSFLTGLLWSEKPESASRTALRQCLHQLRSRLNEPGLDFLTISQDTVEIDRSRIETDIDQLIAGRDLGEFGTAPIDLERLLYGFEDLDPAFVEWLWEQRRLTKLAVCSSLAKQLEQDTPGTTRLETAVVLNSIDPSLEIAARPVIEDHIRSGNVVELLRVYKNLWDSLAEEWEEEPSSELQDLVGEARAKLAEHVPGFQSPADIKVQRKYLCVLALKLHPSSTCSRDSLRELKLRFSQNATAFLNDNAGRLVSIDGCDLCAVFGLPVTHENNARDAVQAALDLQQVFQSCRFAAMPDAQDTQLTIGIDTGVVDVPQSDFDAQESVLKGRALERAAKLTRRAGEDAIFATRRTVSRLQHLFDCVQEPSGPDEPGIVRVRDRAINDDISEQTASERNAFIGRAPFVAILRYAWSETQPDALQIVSLQGPAGVGKTRLVREFLHDIGAEEARTFAVSCNRYDRSAPFEPVQALIRLLSDGTDNVDPKPELLTQRLIELIGYQPTAIFVDDWQWVDHASRLVMQDVVQALQESPVLLILASRDVSIDDGLIRASHQVYLPPMNAKEVERRAEHILQHPIDAQLKAELFSKSGGNPLFLEEMCNAIGRSPNAGSIDHFADTLSANLNGLIASRIDELEPEDAQIVFAIAPHSEVVDLDLMAEVLGHPVREASLERLCALDVLTPGLSDSVVRFKHGITRDVVYSMIPEDVRKSLHRAYFDALRARSSDQDDVVEKLALHARECGEHAVAVDYAERAGVKALRASSLDQAHRQFATAMSIIDGMPETPELQHRWLSLAVRWAQPCVYSASADHMPVLERAKALATELGQEKTLAEVLYWVGYNLLVRGEYELSIEHLTQSNELAAKLGLDRLVAETTAIQGFALAAKTEYRLAGPMIEAAIDAKERNPVKGGRAPVTSVFSRAILSVLYAEHGRFDEAEDLLETALTRVADFRHEIESSILNLGAAVHLWRGQWEQAREYARRSRQRSERVSAPCLIGMSRCLYCYADWQITKNPRNVEELQSTAYWLDAQGMRLYLTFVFGWLADMLAETGRFDEATVAARRALDWAETGESAGASMACRALARVAMAPGREGIDHALVHLAEGRKWAAYRLAEHERGVCKLAEAEFLAQKQRHGEAEVALGLASEIFNRLGMAWHAEQATQIEQSLTRQQRQIAAGS